jgi:diguanylate cyclase (GGDEF)-like protein
VLEGVGNALANSLRPTDVVGRLGGDEFLILLPQADREGARVAMNRAVAGLPSMHINGEEQAISISVGIAAYPQDGETFDALYQAADERLYQAKGVSGRSAVMAEAG